MMQILLALNGLTDTGPYSTYFKVDHLKNINTTQLIKETDTHGKSICVNVKINGRFRI